MVTQTSGPEIKILVVRGDHAALARSDGLTRMKTKARQIADRARALPLISGTKRAGSVFNDPEAVLPCERIDRIHIGTKAEKVYRYDSDSFGGNKTRNLLNVDIESREIDIAKDGTCAYCLHYV